MVKWLTGEINGRLVSVAISRLSVASLHEKMNDLQRRKALLEKKKKSVDLRLQELECEIATIDGEIMVLQQQDIRKLVNEEQAERQRKVMERHLATLSAEQLMLEFFGQDAHDKFMEERQYVFEAKDKETYKLIPEGTVFKKVGEEWKPICLIRPQELPMPDFLIAALTSVKEHPEEYAQNVQR